MKERCAGLAVVLISLVAFGVGNAQQEFHGVIDPNTKDVSVQTAIIIMTPDADTFPTPGWGEGTTLDTFDFPPIARWPDTVVLLGTIASQPNVSHFPDPVAYVWYRFEYGSPIAPMALFYGTTGVEESRSAIQPLQRLNVSPSVVTSQMVVRVQSLGSDRPVVEVYDAAGNVVRSLNCTAGADGLAEATWNREDGLGHLVPEGVYFCRYATSEAVAVRKILVAH